MLQSRKRSVYHMWEQRSMKCQHSERQAASTLMNCWESEENISFLCLYDCRHVSQPGGGGSLQWHHRPCLAHTDIHTAQFCWETVCVALSCRFTLQHIWLQLMVFIHWTGMRHVIRLASADWYCVSYAWIENLVQMKLKWSLQPWNSIHAPNHESGCFWVKN